MNWMNSLASRWKHASSFATATVFMMVPGQAFAQAANQTQVDSMINAILGLLTGSIAKGLATIALVVAGFMFFFGHGNKMLLGSIILGCFIVFGAGWVVSTISGS